MILFKKDGEQGLKNSVDLEIDLTEIRDIMDGEVSINSLSEHNIIKEMINKVNVASPKVIYKYLLQRERKWG